MDVFDWGTATGAVIRWCYHESGYHTYALLGQSYAVHKPVDSIDLVFAPPNQPIIYGIQRTANAVETT